MAIQRTSAFKVHAIALVASILGAPLFARLVDLLTHNQLSCSSIGDIGGCGSYDIFYYFFGFYFAMLFIISVANIGFLSWKRFDYIVISLLMLSLGLLDSEFMKLVIGFLAAGIVLGLIVAQVRKMRATKTA